MELGKLTVNSHFLSQEVSQRERDVGNDMLSVAMIYICWSN